MGRAKVWLHSVVVEGEARGVVAQRGSGGGKQGVWLHSVVVEGEARGVVVCTSRLEMSRATGSKVLVNSRAYCVEGKQHQV